jgi:hypothetical protein
MEVLPQPDDIQAKHEKLFPRVDSIVYWGEVPL